MSATIFPGSIFSAHANKLRAIRLERLAQSVRRPSLASNGRQPILAAPSAPGKRPMARSGILSPLSGIRSR